MSQPATTYRLDPRHALRLMGLRMVVAAVLVFAAAIASAFSATAARILGVLLAIGAVFAVVAAVVALVRPPVVVRLDAGGYRVRRVPECGVRAAPWEQVVRVDDGQGPMGRTLVFRLPDERTTEVPLVLLPRAAEALRRDIQDRLNTAHGYRPMG